MTKDGYGGGASLAERKAKAAELSELGATVAGQKESKLFLDDPALTQQLQAGLAKTHPRIYYERPFILANPHYYPRE